MKRHDLAVIGAALALIAIAVIGLTRAPLATLLLIGLLLLCPLMMPRIHRGGQARGERNSGRSERRLRRH